MQSPKDLLQKYASIMRRLMSAGIIRTMNSPVGDYAELLVSEKLNLKMVRNSQKSYDAVDEKTDETYQIKARWHAGKNKSRQLNVVRTLDFTFLVAVIFDENFNVAEVYKIPSEVIRVYSKMNKHQNGWIPMLRPPMLEDSRVQNIKDLFS